uniref:RNA-directed DNA polymerase n=1 Tax=Strongyloides papillosus TaxID=174720 RepID=A0A0N5B7S2_STREA
MSGSESQRTIEENLDLNVSIAAFRTLNRKRKSPLPEDKINQLAEIHCHCARVPDNKRTKLIESILEEESLLYSNELESTDLYLQASESTTIMNNMSAAPPVVTDYLKSIERFTDVRADMARWLRKFNDAITLQKIPNNDKTRVLALYVCEEISDFIYEKIDEDENITYDEICRQLKKRYNGELGQYALENKMRLFKLNPFEDNFAEKIYQYVDLVKKANRDITDEKKMLREIQRRMGDILKNYQDLWEVTIDAKNTTVTEMIEQIVIKAEMHQFRMQQRRRRTMSDPQARDRQEFKKTCYRCGKPGHLQRDCRADNPVQKKKVDEPLKQANYQNLDCAETRNLEINEDNYFVDNSYNMRSLNQNKNFKLYKGPFIIIPVTIVSKEKEKDSRGFIDTGANVSMINRRAAKELDIDIQDNERIKVTLATGVEKVMTATAVVKLRFKNGKEIQTKMLVSEEENDGYDVAIGSDILEKTSARICYNQSQKAERKEKSATTEVRKMRSEKIGKCSHKIPKFEYCSNQIPKFSRYEIQRRHHQQAQRIIDKWEEDDIIEECPWPKTLLNIHAVPKSEDKIRIVLDCRPVNTLYKPYQFPLPRTDKLLKSLKGTHFTIIDLESYFLQLEIDPTDRPYLAFKDTRGKVFQFNRIPFGLKNASSIAQTISERIIRGTQTKAYIDDFIIATSGSLQAHIDEIVEFSKKLEDLNLTANSEKCKFACTTITALGHIISDKGVVPELHLLDSWINYPIFQSYKSIRRFVGAVSWFRSSIPNLAAAIKPLTKVMNKRGNFQLTEEITKAFQTTKEAIKRTCINYHPDYNLPFILVCDASNGIIASALLQKKSDKYYPIGFFSKSIAERKKFNNIEEVVTNNPMYIPACELELKAVCESLKFFKFIIGQNKVHILTDHKPLISTIKNSSTPLMLRQLSLLQEFNFTIEYLAGVKNQLADAISRATLKKIAVNGIDPTETQKILETTTYIMEEHLPVEEFEDLLQVDVVKSDDDREIHEHDRSVRNSGLQVKKSNKDKNNPALKHDNLTDEMKVEAMKEVHDQLGHQCFEKCISLLKLRYNWRGMSNDLKSHIQKCHICLSKNEPKMIQYQYHHPIATYPMELTNLDACGPFKATERGNKHFLGLVDMLTKFIVIREVKELNSQVVIQFLEEDIICKLGKPTNIRLDNASYLKSNKIQEYLKSQGIKFSYAAPGHHQGNSSIERVFKSLHLIVARMLKEDPQIQWDLILQRAAYYYNIATHSSTQHTPFYLMYGRNPILGENDTVDKERLKNIIDYDYNLVERQINLEHARKIAMEINDDIRKKLNGIVDTKDKHLHIGQRIYIRRPDQKKERKHDSPWINNFVIVGLQDNSIRCRYWDDKNGKLKGKTRIVHLQDVKIDPNGEIMKIPDAETDPLPNDAHSNKENKRSEDNLTVKEHSEIGSEHTTSMDDRGYCNRKVKVIKKGSGQLSRWRMSGSESQRTIEENLDLNVSIAAFRTLNRKRKSPLPEDKINQLAEIHCHCARVPDNKRTKLIESILEEESLLYSNELESTDLYLQASESTTIMNNMSAAPPVVTDYLKSIERFTD